jgi:hypothetical protein
MHGSDSQHRAPRARATSVQANPQMPPAIMKVSAKFNPYTGYITAHSRPGEVRQSAPDRSWVAQPVRTRAAARLHVLRNRAQVPRRPRNGPVAHELLPIWPGALRAIGDRRT